jgi:thiol-disulfide isomerase/thioredoxin
MRTKGLVLAVLLSAGFIAILFVARREEAPVRTAVEGLRAPELMLQDVSGKSYTLSDLRGSVLFINFWATWCLPCREEMPSIQNLYNHFKEEKGFRMITVLYSDDLKNGLAYLKEHDLHIPLFIDNDYITARTYGITGVPETYIVDKKGILKERRLGPARWDSAQVFAFISELLRE